LTRLRCWTSNCDGTRNWKDYSRNQELYQTCSITWVLWSDWTVWYLQSYFSWIGQRPHRCFGSF